ncbi:hypothetical protein FGO68_gene11814 [Halteria grandinella]|uniref:Uncharacterized protein n=1 Tax=Halteria grandinella TaxID=5974 RepID=A0A8J8NS11_HALGN|nr:hypothetical protein FGO68_gene11814 [Halteria grandinella]
MNLLFSAPLSLQTIHIPLYCGNSIISIRVSLRMENIQGNELSTSQESCNLQILSLKFNRQLNQVQRGTFLFNNHQSYLSNFEPIQSWKVKNHSKQLSLRN